MNPLQIYWLTWTPSLLLLFVFFGPYGALAIFIPTFAVCVAHHKQMHLLTFILTALIASLTLLAMFTVIPDLFF